MENIKGILLKEKEIKTWDIQKFNDFFSFADFFYDETGKLIVNKEVVEAVYQYQNSNPFLAEMLERLDRPITDDWNKGSFYMRANILFRTIKNAIIKNPLILDPSLVEKNKSKPQYAWMEGLYAKQGGEIISAIPEDKTIVEVDVVEKEILPSERLQVAIGRVADVYDMIASTITKKDIRAMNVKDKINALNKLSYIHNTTKKFKPNVNFIKINSKTSTAEELESSLLDFDNDED